MIHLKLAFQGWKSGQVLEPEHFHAEEEAIAAHARLAGALAGLPYYGVAELAWNEDALAAGRLAITALSAVYSGGFLVHVPGNATLSDLNLAELEPNRVSVFLHLMRQREEAPRTFPYADDPENVTRIRYRLRLSPEAVIDDAWEALPIGTFERQLTPKGAFRLVRGAVPPLLQVGSNPFLRDRLAELDTALEEVMGHLEASFSDPAARRDARSDARRCHAEATRLRALLRELQAATPEEAIRLHPYHLFDALRTFHYGLSAVYEEAPEIVTYHHGQLGPRLDEMIRRIRGRARGPRVAWKNVSFQRTGPDQPFVARWDEDLPQRPQVLLAVERTKAGERVELRGLKLASAERLDHVIRGSLSGVRFDAVEAPPDAPFDGVDYYKIVTDGDEWKRAADGRVIAYRAHGALTEAWSALCWRSNEPAQRST